MLSRQTLSLPRIDDADSNIVEMGYVARCQRCVSCNNDSRNHRVAQLDWSALFVPESHQIRGVVSRLDVKWRDAVGDFFEKQFESAHQRRAPFARTQYLQA